jgi:hypothetical protein
MTINITLTGRELQLATSATFMAQSWPFKRGSTPRQLLAGTSESTIEAVADQLQEVLFAALRKNDIPLDGWSEEFVDRRRALSGTLELTADEVQCMILSLHACHAAFGGSSAGWLDFRVGSPGNVGAFGLTAHDLLALASRFESVSARP